MKIEICEILNVCWHCVLGDMENVWSFVKF